MISSRSKVKSERKNYLTSAMHIVLPTFPVFLNLLYLSSLTQKLSKNVYFYYDTGYSFFVVQGSLRPTN